MKHPKLIAVLISIILSLVIPEIALQAFDPLQVKPYFADLALLFGNAAADDTRAYVLPAAEYRFSNWTATILPDHSRFVPDTHPSDCVIVFVGDSVTFGHGVNDSETWVNVLAGRFRQVQMVNAALNGYNAAQALATIEMTPATGFLFTLVNNDADPIFDWQRKPTPMLYEPILPVYLYVLGGQQEQASMGDLEAFDAALEVMKQMGNVAIVGFEGDALAARAGVPTVPVWTHTNSPVDGHPSALGSIEVANAMTPYVENLIEQVC